MAADGGRGRDRGMEGEAPRGREPEPATDPGSGHREDAIEHDVPFVVAILSVLVGVAAAVGMARELRKHGVKVNPLLARLYFFHYLAEYRRITLARDRAGRSAAWRLRRGDDRRPGVRRDRPGAARDVGEAARFAAAPRRRGPNVFRR